MSDLRSDGEIHDVLQCPGCKKLFDASEGPLCSCEEDARDVMEEMNISRRELELEEKEEKWVEKRR